MVRNTNNSGKLQLQNNPAVRTLLLASFFCFVQSLSFGQRLPSFLKANWISASKEPQYKLDSFLLINDDENIDTARCFYTYFRYKKKSLFFVASMDKRQFGRPSDPYATVEKWRLKKIDSGRYLLHRKRLKSDISYKHILLPNYDLGGKLKSILLIRWRKAERD